VRPLARPASLTPFGEESSLRSHRVRRLLVIIPILSLTLGIGLIGSDLVRPAYAAPDEDYRLSSLRVFNRVVLLVKEQYVEPQRIRPREMLVAALEAVEKRVPEVLVESPEGDSIGIVVGDERRTFFLDDLNSLWELSFKLRDVFRFLESRISVDVERREVEYAAVNGMLGKLDPHSILLEPRYSKEMKLSTKGEFGGLGIVISSRDGYLTVISPIDGTPADRAGIQAQDRIVKIGEESTINMGLDEAVEKLRGPPGTTVTIWITRKGLDEPKRVDIVRDIIKVDSVTHQLLDGKLGYVKIKQFQSNTAEDVAGSVAKMQQEAGGSLNGLVLDLRNNPGGLLDQSVEVANLFLRDGVLVVTQEGGTHGERKEVRATRRPDKIDVPIIVLVNGGSASASEIVAGAVKNRGRGLIIGDQSFGKGSVQQLYDFPDSSSLKLTIGQYLTPGDESIQSVGITPDVKIRPVLVESKEDINLFPDSHPRESDLERHLDDARTRKKKPSFQLSFLDKILEESEQQRRATSSTFHDDFEIRLARATLARVTGRDRSALLKAAGPAVEEARSEEAKRIAKALSELGVDWKPGASATGGKIAARVISAEPAVAGEELAVEIEVENTGTAPLYQVYGNSESTIGLLHDREYLFGHLAPGEKKRWRAGVRVPKNLASRHDLMRVAFKSAGGAELAKLDVPVSVRGLERPRFSYALFLDDGEKGNGDGMLQVGEQVSLVVQIKNLGPGTAEQPAALLKNLGGPAIFIESGRQTLDELKPGAAATARFSFRVREPARKADLRLQVFDGVMGDYLLERLRFPIRARGESARPSKGVVQAGKDGVEVRAAADNDSAVLARVSAGSRLASVAEVGSYVRVRAGDLVGYVASADVAKATGRVDAKGVPKGLSMVYGREPPSVSFEGLPEDGAVRVKGDEYALKVKVQDDTPVRDIYIFVNDEKVFYEVVDEKSAQKAVLDLPVKLEPGLNIVTVVAREDDEFAQREILAVFSEKGDPFADKQ
jgi:carboxyl-terminal processing protease